MDNIKKRQIVVEDLLLDTSGKSEPQDMPTANGGIFPGTPISSNTIPLIENLRTLMNNAYSVGEGFKYILEKISGSTSDATTEKKGLIELATAAEVAALTDYNKAITPHGLAQLKATTEQYGIMRFATVEECQARQSTEKAVTPAGMASIQWDIGSVRLYYGETPPVGWLSMNGALVARATYPNLWEHVKGRAILDGDWTAGQYGKFSQGNGSTTFRLPDARGNFIRIWDNGRGLDPDANKRAGGDTIGSVQADEFKSHNHGVAFTGYAGSLTGSPGHIGLNSASIQGHVTGRGGFGIFTDGRESPGGNETRPVNINLLLIIKAK